MKQCIKCLEIKDLTEFYKRSSGRIDTRCKTCCIKQANSWQKANPEKRKAQEAKHRLINKDKIKEQQYAWRKRNPSKYKAIQDIWAINNPDKVKAKYQRYYNKNIHKMLAKNAKRRAKLLQATPTWLTQEHLLEIEELYLLAQDLNWLCYDDHLEVDHIIPLQGKDVSGLHVPWNLQLIPSKLNYKKSNKLWL